MWKLNMVVCIAIAFGCFGWAMFKTMTTESKKK